MGGKSRDAEHASHSGSHGIPRTCVERTPPAFACNAHQACNPHLSLRDSAQWHATDTCHCHATHTVHCHATQPGRHSATHTSHRQMAHTLHAAHICHATHSCRYQACNAQPTNDDAHLSLPDGVKLACNAHLACNTHLSLSMQGSPVTLFQRTPVQWHTTTPTWHTTPTCQWHAHLAHSAHLTTQTCHTTDDEISTQRTRGIQCLPATGNAHLTDSAHVMQRTRGMPRTPSCNTPRAWIVHPGGMRRTYDGGANRHCGGRRRS